MSNDINEKLDNILTYANEILALKSKLKTVQTSSEKSNINASINYYTALIDRFTNNSSNYIISCTQKINSIKQNSITENDSIKIKNSNNLLDFYMNHIKSRIDNSVIISGSETKTKPAVFRDSQKIDLLAQAREISEMCESHQKDIKSSKSFER